MQSKVKVSYEEKQSNKLLIHKQFVFDSMTEAYKFSRQVYMSGLSKGKPVIEERAA